MSTDKKFAITFEGFLQFEGNPQAGKSFASRARHHHHVLVTRATDPGIVESGLHGEEAADNFRPGRPEG